MTEEPLPALPPASERQGVPGHDQALDRANAIRLLTLRSARMTYAQMAEQLGYADASGARQALLRALDRHEAENAAQLRTLENLSMDADERVLRSVIGNGALPVTERLRAIDARTRLSARRSRLNGLDAPVQIAVGAGSLAELDDALALLENVVRGEVVHSDRDPAGADAGPDQHTTPDGGHRDAGHSDSPGPAAGSPGDH